MKQIAWIALVSITTPFMGSAQSLEWSVHPTVLFDLGHTTALEVGPSVSFLSFLSRGGPISHGLFLTLARTDFPVASDDLHRNFGSVGVGLRWMMGGERAALGLDVGVGFLA